MTDSPTSSGRYIKLSKNPNPSSNKVAYIRKYVRHDKIKTRGEVLKKYKLSKEDYKKVIEFLNNHKKK